VDATRPEVANGAGFDRSMQQNQDDNPVLGAIMNRNAPPAPSVAPAPRQFSDATASDLSGLLGMGYLTDERVMVADASGAVGIGLRGGSLKLTADPGDSQPEDDYLRSQLNARRSANDDLANAIADLKGRLFNDQLQEQTQKINAERQQFGVTDSQALSAQILGGLHGIAAFGFDSINGTVRAIGNVTLGLGDFLTLGVNHDNPTIRQANIENGALLSGLYKAVTSPREAMTNAFESIAAREASAKALDAAGRYEAAAAIRSQTVASIAAPLLGGVGGMVRRRGITSNAIGDPFVPPQTGAEVRVVRFGNGDAVYTLDKETGATLAIAGKITGFHPGRVKATPPDPIGGLKPGDHRGHMIPEGGVDNPAYVNTPLNIISEAPSSNLGLKRSLDYQASKLAQRNPNSEVIMYGLKQPGTYSLRPNAVTYYVTADNILVTAMSILNP
jgi:hypothetical protein